MPTSIRILSWNIQILGETKISRLLCPNVLASVIYGGEADVVAIQEPVYNYASQVADELIAALATLNQEDWTGTWVQALPGGRDRDGYLFLWRSGKYKQQEIGGAKVAGTFKGNFPTNESNRNGRRVGYVGLTLADGSHPFIVAAYHAPVQDGAFSAPATALVAIKDQAAQLTTYTDGGAKAYEARFLCADFNLDINEAGVKAEWYQPAMDATTTTNVTAAKTILLPAKQIPNPPPADSAAYLNKNLDNILAGPAASITANEVVNTIDTVSEKTVSNIIESFHVTNELPTWWNPKSVYTRYDFVLRYMSDHLPVFATFQLVA
jgi:endonuclease/exonuclease/phosphatase family metal-dependent hydrolase